MAKRCVLLTWEGKTEALDSLKAPAVALELEEEFGSSGTCSSPGSARTADRVIQGDALPVARALEIEGFGGQVDLIYIDPPYASGVDYSHEERLDGHRRGRVARAAAYCDRWDGGPASYLDMLLPRLAAMARLLKPTGSIWIQVDWRASYLVRMLCDELFGRDRFLNEIVWRRAPNLGRQARSGQFGRTLDTLIVYGGGPVARLVPPQRLVPIPRRTARRDPDSGRWFTLAPRGDYTDASVARLEAQGRIHRAASGNISIKYWLEEDEAGRLAKRQPVDALWIDIPPLRHAVTHERTGYPTQKPRALLERVISAGSPAGGLVLDLFAGSGTTGAAAARLGRRFILGDDSPVATATMRSRLLREGVTDLRFERCGAPRQREEAHIEIHPHGVNAMEVALSCRAGTQPIAWALSLAAASGKPFRADWHAERGAGRRPAELPLTAIVPKSSSVQGRVYFVDGKIAAVTASLATAPPSESMSLSEAPL